MRRCKAHDELVATLLFYAQCERCLLLLCMSCMERCIKKQRQRQRLASNAKATTMRDQNEPTRYKVQVHPVPSLSRLISVFELPLVLGIITFCMDLLIRLRPTSWRPPPRRSSEGNGWHVVLLDFSTANPFHVANNSRRAAV